MKIYIILATALVSFACCSFADAEGNVALPEPVIDTGMNLMEAIESRRSVRNYSSSGISLLQLSVILHSAQGITSSRGYRATPSAGATYPMTLYVMAENVNGLESGVYRYLPEDHVLEPVLSGYYLNELQEASLGQPCVGDCAAAVVIASDYSITTAVYGDRGVRYVDMEAGHISQNVYLACTAMDMGTVAVGAFTDQEISQLLQLDDDLVPLYIMPLGSI